jgi:hypothetical protein
LSSNAVSFGSALFFGVAAGTFALVLVVAAMGSIATMVGRRARGFSYANANASAKTA